MTNITACVLAGGAGSRMGGQDKGLVPWQGRPLVEWVLERITPQVDSIVISANRNQNLYARYGHAVIADMHLTGNQFTPGDNPTRWEQTLAQSAGNDSGNDTPPSKMDYAGPLAGILACLKANQNNVQNTDANTSKHVAAQWLSVVPCDAPRLPTDLVQRLHQHAVKAGALLAYATTPDGAQPTFCLIHQALAPSLENYLAQGERKVLTWFTQCQALPVAFDDQPDAFLNVNQLP